MRPKILFLLSLCFRFIKYWFVLVAVVLLFMLFYEARRYSFLRQCWQNFRDLEGSSLFGIVIVNLVAPILLIALTFVISGFLYGFPTAKERYTVDAATGLVAFFIVYFVLVHSSAFVWSLAKTRFDDHGLLVGRTARLEEENTKLQQDLAKRSPGRFLSQEDIGKGVAALGKFPKRTYVGIAAVRDIEAMSYALQFAELFRQAGWTPLLYCSRLPGPVPSGIVIFSHLQQNMPDVTPLVSLLEAMGLPYARPGALKDAHDYPINMGKCELCPVLPELDVHQVSTDDLVLFVGRK
jgi:hypothetical protein